MVELAVVGAGPCGLGVGVAARQAGMECVIFDKGPITSAIGMYPTHMTFFSTAERLELGGVPFITAADKPTRRDALKYYRRIVDVFELDVHQYEGVTEIGGERGAFRLRTLRKDGDVAEYAARNVVIATGYLDTPRLMGIPGEDLPKVFHYYKEGYPYSREDCLVVGAGNSAVDVALDLYRWGARVTLVHFADALDPGVKPWILPDIANRIKTGEIAVRWRSRLAEIRPRSVVLRSDETGEAEELPNDWVFAMTGYIPEPTLLRQLGVSIDAQTGIPRHDRETMETDVPGVFIAGVVAAGYDANKIFIENGREHGPRIVRAILGR
ncbi:MAG TPA: YpdA family putative bacillithiol disulfide reductase [Longimicrobiales bacterium]|nr:YpdA family putative bacillithiol disulfide reductase [Longimicrobiales bacterium]